MKSIRESRVSYKRLNTPELEHLDKITNSRDVARFFHTLWEHDMDVVERVYAIYVNNANKPIAFSLISLGGITGTVIDPRVVFQQAVLNGATGLFIAHNHPTGRLEPSIQDNAITTKLRDGGKLLEIKLFDHIILSPTGDYYSYADKGNIL